jgi:phosphatidate phosphatase APP1
MSPSTEDLIASMELPPRPEDIDVESEMRALKDYKLNNLSSSSLLFDRTSIRSSVSTASTDSLPIISTPDTPQPGKLRAVTPPRAPPSPHATDVLKRLHRNLETRLHPFWATALPARQVRISLFAFDPPEDRARRTPEELELLDAPLVSLTVATTADGAFSVRFTVPWEDLCHHPRGIHVAFSPTAREDAFGVAAELLPAATAPPLDRLRSALTAGAPVARADASIPLEHAAVRVISDIDDTVKLSGVLTGARAVFYNVFVRDLRENLIPGMGEWYQEMWGRGARFHYVVRCTLYM